MKSLTIRITEESYQILENLIGITWTLENGDNYAINNKSKAIDILLKALVIKNINTLRKDKETLKSLIEIQEEWEKELEKNPNIRYEDILKKHFGVKDE